MGTHGATGNGSDINAAQRAPSTARSILCRNSRYQDLKYLLDHRVYLARTLHRIESFGLTEKDQFEFELLL